MQFYIRYSQRLGILMAKREWYCFLSSKQCPLLCLISQLVKRYINMPPPRKLILRHTNTVREENRGQQEECCCVSDWLSLSVSPGRMPSDGCLLLPASSGHLGYRLATTRDPRRSSGPSVLGGRLVFLRERGRQLHIQVSAHKHGSNKCINICAVSGLQPAARGHTVGHRMCATGPCGTNIN